jgi:hypothetical protein
MKIPGAAGDVAALFDYFSAAMSSGVTVKRIENVTTNELLAWLECQVLPELRLPENLGATVLVYYAGACVAGEGRGRGRGRGRESVRAGVAECSLCGAFANVVGAVSVDIPRSWAPS